MLRQLIQIITQTESRQRRDTGCTFHSNILNEMYVFIKDYYVITVFLALYQNIKKLTNKQLNKLFIQTIGTSDCRHTRINIK